MGVGPAKGFSISGREENWEQFLPMDQSVFSMVQSYVYLKVRLLFDPPINSAAVEAINRQISEFEWRLHVAADPEDDLNRKEEIQNGRT